MMSTGSWEDLAGTVLEEKYSLQTLVASGPAQAEFLARPVSPAGEGQACSVTVIAPDPEEIEEQLAAIERAKALQHPNLLRILDGGRCAVGTGGTLYVATEAAECTLAQEVAAGPLPDATARVLAEDLVAALEYLHAQGLVCRSLEPDVIVRVGDHWKLADLSQMSPAGETGSGVVGGGSNLPPEASAGSIAPGWDIWALGVTLRAALAKPGREGIRTPFDAVVNGCLEPDPGKRLSLKEIRRLLEPEAKPATALLEAKPEEQRPGANSARSRMALMAGALGVAVLSVVLVLVFREPAPAPAPDVTPPPAPALAEQTVSAPAGRPSPFSEKAAAPDKSSELPAAAPQPDADESKSERAELTGRAGYFGDDLNGRPTASGERFSNDAMTAAHSDFPFGTRLRVRNLRNGRSVVVRVNDRAALRGGFVLRVTRAAARKLGFERAGSARVRIEVIQ